MPHDSKLLININILHPQGNPEKLVMRLSKWALSAGRYLIIFVEIIVLGAFLSRFKFDNDLSETKDKIKHQIPYVQSKVPDENLIRKTQLQLAIIKKTYAERIDYSAVLQKVSKQTPGGIHLTTLNIEKTSTEAALRISGRSESNNDIASLVYGLKNDDSFANVTLASASLDQAVISFSLTAQVKGTNGQ